MKQLTAVTRSCFYFFLCYVVACQQPNESRKTTEAATYPSFTLPPPALPAQPGVQQAAVQQPQNSAANAVIKPAAFVNPEHGKPGHRCDIAVGAPLPASSSPAQQVAVQPAVQAIPAAGLNPEHGKPGHRCDIAVGAPLNSKPLAPTVAKAQQPVVQKASADTTTYPPGINPPHGKPGHRCDIAVGAKLDSANTKE